VTAVKKYMHSAAERHVDQLGRDFSHSPVLAQTVFDQGQKNPCTADLNPARDACEGFLAILWLWRSWFMTTVKKYLHSRGEPDHGDAAPSNFSHSPALAQMFFDRGQKIHA
jgi:hypothetical protein